MRKDHFTVGDLVKFTKLSLHMVNYLCRHDLLVPSLSEHRRRGKQRRFSYVDLLLARAISRLLDSGVSVLSLRKALSTLRSKIESVPAASFACRLVAIAGDSVYLAQPGQTLIDLTAGGQLAFHFVLDSQGLPRSRKASPSAKRLSKAAVG